MNTLLYTSIKRHRRANPDPSKYYNGKQAAKELGISRTTLGRKLKAGELPEPEKRSGVLLFDREAIDQLANDYYRLSTGCTDEEGSRPVAN